MFPCPPRNQPPSPQGKTVGGWSPAEDRAAMQDIKREADQIRFCTLSAHRTVYAGTRYFDHRGRAQGRRGFRCLPDRFARPP